MILIIKCYFAVPVVKGLKFVRAEVTSFPVTLCVVLRLRKEYLYLSRHGNKVTASELDKNVTFRSSRLSKREYFTLQVESLSYTY